jgi:hypothetical protein
MKFSTQTAHGFSNVFTDQEETGGKSSYTICDTMKSRFSEHTPEKSFFFGWQARMSMPEKCHWQECASYRRGFLPIYDPRRYHWRCWNCGQML